MAFEGPIPGENYTSDTKNYPWHRPPEFTDLDEAIEASFKKLTGEEESISLLTMVEMGIDIATLTDMFVTAGIGAGKWTPDFAIILAGPVSHIIYLMAKGYGLDCDLGLDDGKSRPPTKAFFDAVKKIDPKRASAAVDDLEVSDVQGNTPDVPEPKGFMGAAPEGMVPETPEAPEEEVM